MNPLPTISWVEANQQCQALWRSESGHPPPERVVIADDRLSADAAYRLACGGTAMLWRGDFQNARQLLQALGRRIAPKKHKKSKPTAPLPHAFHLHRQAQAQRAKILGMLLIPFDAHHHIPLPRAPHVQAACTQVYGESDTPYITSLRELSGIIGAYEWRKKGVEIPALNGRIYPHYGVFSPVRGEYMELAAKAPLPASKTQAFDIGTGTGVLAALLARRGVERVTATDQDPRALACARANIAQLGLSQQINVLQANLFPPGRAPLIVCNPPWLPAKPSSPLEHAIYDPHSSMLSGFLLGLAQHLEPQGQAWLILSDLAEHLKLRTRADLVTTIHAAGLQVLDKTDVRPHHPRVTDTSDPLHDARSAEVTSLWRLGMQIF